jgi:hypothetical protein
VCAAIAKSTGFWGNCGGLAWERTYRLNDKYTCPKDDSGTSTCASYEQLYCPYWGCERWATRLKGEVHTSHGTAILLQKREATPDCTHGACNPVNFVIFNLNETGQEVGKKFDILIHKKETDPGTSLHFQLIMLTHENSSYQVFHSFYEKIQSEVPISVTTKNLFLYFSRIFTDIWFCNCMRRKWPCARRQREELI